jgi:hypothetical protein
MRSIKRAGLLLLGLGLTASAAASPGQDDASNTMRDVARDFSRLRSYHMTAQVAGGLARGVDHRLHESTVNESFAADVFRTVCRVDGPRQAFRMRTGRQEQGAIAREDGRWAGILTTDEGRLVQRLFLPPEQLLGEANRLRRHAQWVDDGTSSQGSSRDRAAPLPRSDEDGTQARDQQDDETGEAAPGPETHHLRVEGPPEVALEHFITITNSGCFSEG